MSLHERQPENHYDRRLREQREQREAEERQQRARETRNAEVAATNQTAWNEWFSAAFQNHLFVHLREGILHDVLAETLGTTRRELREDYETQINKLKERIKQLEEGATVDARFNELEARLAGRHELESALQAHERRHTEAIEQATQRITMLESELESEIAATRGAIEAINRELTDGVTKRIGDLEVIYWSHRQTQSKELTDKLTAFERHADDVAAELKEVRRDLARAKDTAQQIHGMEMRLDERRIATDEAKRRSELPQSELLARVAGLERQLADLEKVAAQPGPQGPPGPPGRLPLAKEYTAGCVHYEADVVVHAGALWQARGDTVHAAPPHSDWVCLARAGRDGQTPNIRGTYDAYGKYKKLDIVGSDGASFVAKRDNPGICPGDGWQLMSKQGRQGRKGESIIGPCGEKGDKGEPGATIRSWQLDRERYRVSPLMSDGTVGPMMEFRPMFEWFLHETGGWNERN